MFDFYEKRKIRSFIYSKISIGLILLIAIVISISTYERFTVEQQMLDRRDNKQIELDALRERAALLESKVDHLENERGIEEELRGRFDVAKEGEQVVIILDDENNIESDLESLSQQPGEPGKDEQTFIDLLKFW